MKIKTKFFAIAALLAANVSLMGAGTAFAAEMSVNKFQPKATVAGKTLQLNGSGIRYRSVFKVYDLALYTAKEVKSLDEIKLNQPVALRFVALRDITGTELGRAFFRSLSTNTPPAELNKHLVNSSRFLDLFSIKTKMVNGDKFSIEYTPGKGTHFYMDGVVQGEPLGDEEFFRIILKIWLGDIPADIRLKDALLDVS